MSAPGWKGSDERYVLQLQAGAPTVYVSRACARRLLTDKRVRVEHLPFLGADRSWRPLTQKTKHEPLMRYRVKLAARQGELFGAATLDYDALIAHGLSEYGYAQGTKECVAMARGAEWALANLRKSRA